MNVTLTLTFKHGTDPLQARKNAQAIAQGVADDLAESGNEVFGDACPTKIKVGPVTNIFAGRPKEKKR